MDCFLKAFSGDNPDDPELGQERESKSWARVQISLLLLRVKWDKNGAAKMLSEVAFVVQLCTRCRRFDGGGSTIC